MASALEKRYLLTIYLLCKEGAAVRSVDIAQKLSVSRPSVAKQMKMLLDHGLIEKEHYGSILLSPVGTRIAGELHLHYMLCRTYLMQQLGVSAKNAEADAVQCVCEWTQESLEKLSTFMIAHAQTQGTPEQQSGVAL